MGKCKSYVLETQYDNSISSYDWKLEMWKCVHYDCMERIEYDGDIGLNGQTNTRPCKGTVSSLNAVHTLPFQRCALDCTTTSF